MKLCYILFLFPFLSMVASSSKESGPFKVIMLDVTNRCNKTTQPFEKVPTVQSIFWAYNTTDNHSLVSGNVTSYNDQKNLKGSIKVYEEKDGKKKINQILDRINCKSFVVPTLMKLWGNDTWKDYCTIPKGTYYFKMDYNKAVHLWRKEMKYGVLVTKLELARGSETVFCLESKMIMVPDTPHKMAGTRRKNKSLQSVIV